MCVDEKTLVVRGDCAIEKGIMQERKPARLAATGRLKASSLVVYGTKTLLSSRMQQSIVGLRRNGILDDE